MFLGSNTKVLPPEEKIALDESDENTDDDELDEVAKGVG